MFFFLESLSHFLNKIVYVDGTGVREQSKYLQLADF